MKRSTRQFFLFTLFASLLMTQAYAQVGNIRGTVTDPEGNPIEGVTIRIEGMEVARQYTVETDAKGEYYHGGVTRQGTYRVIAKKEGYQSAFGEGVRATTDRRGEQGLVDFTLQRGLSGPLLFELTDEQIEQMKADVEDAGRRQQSAAEVRLNMDQGLQFFNQGEYEQALTVFNAALELDDQQPALWANVGNTHSKLNQHEQAVEAYQKALDLAPEDPTLYQNLGGLYASMGDTEKARELYQKAVSLSAYGDPRDAAVNYYNMGVTFINSGKSEEAIEALTKALEADPEYAEAHYQLGISMLGTGQMEESADHLKKYLELAPEGANAEVAKQLVEQLGL
ncbi:MAG: tetratricopeptide repeat protein [Acidobacteria bacterium]|nr:tetratricopeptide repeat protein [Acidobacteriota bacterium]